MRKNLLIMCPLDALLVKLVVEDGYQELLINEVQFLKLDLHPLGFVKLEIDQNP